MKTKNILLILLILSITSCNQHKSTPVVQEEIIEEEIEISETISLDDFAEEIEEVAIGGNGIVFENGGMSFTAESLESTFEEAEGQLNDIKTKYKYESKEIKESAIESMELNLDLFRGTFCCTTHNSKHCEDSKNLKDLENKYSCVRFMKKK